MSLSDRDVQATALLCIKQHGGSAAYYAAGRTDELLEQGAIEGAKDVAACAGGDRAAVARAPDQARQSTERFATELPSSSMRYFPIA